MNFNLLATSAWRREVGTKAASSSGGPGQATVFIVADNSENLRAMRLALTAETCRIETAASAESAIRRLSTAPPDLILLDTQVLTDDGTLLARTLLADARLVSVPIVALTGQGAGGHVSLDADSRFDGRIAKPIDPRTFPGEVRSFLDSLSQASQTCPSDLLVPDAAAGDRWKQVANLLDAIEAGLPDSQFCAVTRPTLRRLAEAMEELPHSEVAAYLQQAERLSSAATARGRTRFRLVIEHCRELVDIAADATPGLAELSSGYLDRRHAELDNLERSLRNSDFAALRKAGHNLKGTGAAYGFGELTAIGRALEAAAKEADAAAVEDLLTQIDSYIGIVQPSLK
ncbi:MAG: response regulator [Bryobacteraceae bacterium]|jgi:CheY-like chemotaxis protein